jgi:L-threonylcarbamoyladenylate synthase
VGLESTVIAVTQDGMEVLRPGMAFVEDAVAARNSDLPGTGHRSPGQHKKHYSPRTRVLLVSRGHLPREGRGAYLWIAQEAAAAFSVQMPERPEAYAAQLYTRLHELDLEGLDWIAVELPPEEREWTAIRDRLTRAAY